MPRYFFNCEGAQNFVDEVGTELAGPRQAQVEAIRQSGEILQDHAEGFADRPAWRVFVTDEAGDTVFELKFEGAGRAGAH